jgi:GTPase SAR1 family protein
MNRYTKDEFSLGNQPTVGVDFVSKSIQMEGKTVRLQLWDTAG